MSACVSMMYHLIGHTNLFFSTAEASLHCIALTALLERGTYILSTWLDIQFRFHIIDCSRQIVNVVLQLIEKQVFIKFWGEVVLTE